MSLSLNSSVALPSLSPALSPTLPQPQEKQETKKTEGTMLNFKPHACVALSSLSPALSLTLPQPQEKQETKKKGRNHAKL